MVKWLSFWRGFVDQIIHPLCFRDAAGNQCCYNTAGSLMFAADTFQGSTPDRSHAWGALPYSKPGYVPLMSHGLHDVVPFFYCCLWTEFGQDCHKYMDLRPTRDCTGYTPPRAGRLRILSDEF